MRAAWFLRVEWSVIPVDKNVNVSVDPKVDWLHSTPLPGAWIGQRVEEETKMKRLLGREEDILKLTEARERGRLLLWGRVVK